MEELFKAIPEYLKRGDEVVANHFSPSQLEKPLCLWNFEYLHLKERRRDVPVGAPAPAGGALHDCLQSIICDGADQEEALNAAVFKLRNHNARDELDAVKVERYIDDLPEMVEIGLDALRSTMKAQGEIQATEEKVLGFEHPKLDIPIIGYADLTTKSSVIEIKTKWAKAGAIKKDGTRGFSVPTLPKVPDAAHVRQVAFYRACTGLPPTIIYINARDWCAFTQGNCDELQPYNLDNHLNFLVQAAIVRQNLMKISNDPKVLAGYIQPAWNDFRWNIGGEFLAEAKEIWKL